MTAVLQLVRHLEGPPTVAMVAGVRIRGFEGPDDIPHWLELRHRAFARQPVGVRQWTPQDFEREFLAKSWWNPGRMWFAETVEPTPTTIGTVALAERGVGDATTPAVHWLAVTPAWRRRGVGRLLMSHLESYCWLHEMRDIVLETHSRWSEAVRFYADLGYVTK